MHIEKFSLNFFLNLISYYEIMEQITIQFPGVIVAFEGDASSTLGQNASSDFNSRPCV